MATSNAHFDAIFAELGRRRLDFVEYRQALLAQFPDEAERKAFSAYQVGKSLPHVADPSGILTPAQFIDIADSINFLDPAARARLLPGLQWQYRPWIPLGYTDSTLYRLLPSIDNLTVRQQVTLLPTDYQLLPAAFLGVNIVVQPRESDDSTASSSTVTPAPAPALGFVVHELGTLQYLECDTAEEMPTSLEEGDDCEADWEETGFCVVGRLDPLGHLRGVYVIYDMYPRQEDGTRKQVTHAEWGIPPYPAGEQFSCARIGTALRDFGFRYPLAWMEKIEHPVELVRAVRSSDGGAMRITVNGRCE